MPESQPNYLQQGADGSVTALFSGGVAISPVADLFDPFSAGKSISWYKGPGQSGLVASIDGRADNVPSDDGTRGDLILRAQNIADISRLSTVQLQSGDNASAAQVFASADNGINQRVRTIIDENAKSSYIQTDPNSNGGVLRQSLCVFSQLFSTPAFTNGSDTGVGNLTFHAPFNITGWGGAFTIQNGGTLQFAFCPQSMSETFRSGNTVQIQLNVHSFVTIGGGGTMNLGGIVVLSGD